MTAFSKILTGAAGLAALAGAATPAAAQYYPSPYGNSGVLGSILNGLLGGGYGGYGGYNSYGGNQNYQVQACVAESQRRIDSLGYGGYGGYGGGYGQYGYGQYGGGYNGYGGTRIAGITSVERKTYGLRVKGDAYSANNAYGANNYGYGQYGGYGAYGSPYGGQAPDVTFSCRVDSRGRVIGVELYRRQDGRRIG